MTPRRHGQLRVSTAGGMARTGLSERSDVIGASAELDGDDDAGSPQWPTLQYLGLARLIIAIGLLLAAAALGGTIGGGSARAYFAAASIYFVGSVVLAVASMYIRRRAIAHIAAQIAFDLVLISALMIPSGGLRSGLVVLYLLPLAGATTLTVLAKLFLFIAGCYLFAHFPEEKFTRLSRRLKGTTTALTITILGVGLRLRRLLDTSASRWLSVRCL